MSGHHFPDEILLDICKRLPVKAVGRFRCVNKSLCSLLQNPSFIQMHLNHSIEKDKFNLLISSVGVGLEFSVSSMASRSDSSLLLSDYEAKEIDFPFKSQGPLVEIIGSCNGLICLELARCHVCIWNPSTTEFKKIQTHPQIFEPKSIESGCGPGKGYSYGFGYDSKIGDYKLVRFLRVPHVMHLSAGSIYMLGTNTWKRTESIRYDVAGGQPGVYVNGILYWIAACTRDGEGRPRFGFCLVLFSFDVCDESVHEIELPDGSYGNMVLSLGVFDGNLCLVSEVPGIHTTVWELKVIGENKGNWNKLFTIEKGINLWKPLHSFKTGEILFELNKNEADERNGMVLYDPKHKRSMVLKINGTRKLFGVESYFSSLVSLKSGNFVGAREFEELLVS